ncbi:Transmembrane GTPase fzo1 [Sphaceloma murrayae]|uniref:Transmembrane GTPase fzo1 n=1 Tax=Sphaceloma murrayae TaxID=2082308 RepID=A0A2K1QRC9_9PEZI|nr:Transmembrane GTPase fzo1 [Sphaceloma murrayae]
MSFDGPSNTGSSSPGAGSSGTGRQNGRPQYMTVGSGQDPAYASHLRSMLDQDSGYGGSIADTDSAAEGWVPDSPSSFGLPERLGALQSGEANRFSEPKSQSDVFAEDNERRAMASHVLQLQYNQNRTALARAITQTVEILKRLQEMNSQWPAHYPTVKRPLSPPSSRPDARPGLHHTQSTLDRHNEVQRPRPAGLQRAGTSLGELNSRAESPSSHSRSQSLEPRLVTPQLAQQFSVLKIELKMEGASQTELVHSLEKQSIASLLDGQINNSIRHLFSLRERIEDTSSKVLVTGDLNAGKSTFCNALLRRKVLPEDQQPCTAIFCEVLDVRENGGLEEVHAIPIGITYNRNDESTYHVYQLKQLEDIVIENERYSQCKIYVKDIRSVDQSLLNNGVVDIALIDAPGLNNDSLKTTAVFARQEEIDVVVFVVSAANHFTLSAKEFIFNAAREKAYIFMVVNGFDNIRDKKRCQETILKQVAQLSPATFKESAELVHFVSSNAIPVAPAGSPPSGPPDSAPNPNSNPSLPPTHDEDDTPSDDETTKHGSPGSPPSDKKKDKGKARAQIDDFNELEASLRRFVLEKRARSKLAPARTYLLNVLGDLSSLASVNRDVAGNELARVEAELRDLEPELEKSRRARSKAGEEAEGLVDDSATRVYEEVRGELNRTIQGIAGGELGVRYPGLWNVYDYADELKRGMLERIAGRVKVCEERARGRTVDGVNAISSLGIMHLGEGYQELTFKSEKMFRSRRDALARQVDVEVELWDFVNLQALWERQEKVVGSGMAVTVAGVVGGRVFGGVGWLDSALGVMKVVGPGNLKRVVVPGLALAVALTLSYALSSIPSTLPHTLARKLSTALAELDYTHSNASRISSEVRRALSYPSARLREGLQRGVEKLADERESKRKLKTESEVARKYFGNLVREAGDVKARVETVDLEGTAAPYAAVEG